MRYDEETYGRLFADIYDTFYPGFEAEALDMLEDLASGGRVLELGVGTGRVALPLAERGLDVTGVDASDAMIAKLRAKPGSDRIRVIQSSFAKLPSELDGEWFDLIFVVFNTFFALLSQAEQVQCFRGVAEHLTADGRFLIEAFVPDLTRFRDGQAVRVSDLDDDIVCVDAAELDLAEQQIVSQQVLISDEGAKLLPVKLRYAWPSEMDLMARLAGLSLIERWGSWGKDPFSKTSTKHVSVYGYAG